MLVGTDGDIIYANPTAMGMLADGAFIRIRSNKISETRKSMSHKCWAPTRRPLGPHGDITLITGLAESG